MVLPDTCNCTAPRLFDRELPHRSGESAQQTFGRLGKSSEQPCLLVHICTPFVLSVVLCEYSVFVAVFRLARCVCDNRRTTSTKNVHPKSCCPVAIHSPCASPRVIIIFSSMAHRFLEGCSQLQKRRVGSLHSFRLCLQFVMALCSNCSASCAPVHRNCVRLSAL